MELFESNDQELVDIVIVELNRHLEESINEGTLPGELIGSEMYRLSLELIRVIIIASDIIGEPVTNDQLKELALLLYFTILYILNHDSESAKNADIISKKYESILLRCLSKHNEKIKSDYSGYDLNTSTIPTLHGARLPLNHKAFIEKFREIYPLGFPDGYDGYAKVIDGFAENRQKLKPSKAVTNVADKNICLRRVIAFCICIQYMDKKIDRETFVKNLMMEYIEETFTDPKSGKNMVSPFNVIKTLYGWQLKTGQPGDERDLTLFKWLSKKEGYEFRRDNYDKMIHDFPLEHQKALEILGKK